jgi:hypothetical protein
MNYDETIDYLYRLQWHGIRLDLARRAPAGCAGRPRTLPRDPRRRDERQGSTAAMLASMLGAAGYSVGL